MTQSYVTDPCYYNSLGVDIKLAVVLWPVPRGASIINSEGPLENVHLLALLATKDYHLYTPQTEKPKVYIPNGMARANMHIIYSIRHLGVPIDPHSIDRGSYVRMHGKNTQNGIYLTNSYFTEIYIIL